MAIRPYTDLGRRAETYLATIAATGNFILFYASHRRLARFGAWSPVLFRSLSRIVLNYSAFGKRSIMAGSFAARQSKTIWHDPSDGKRLVVCADEKLTALLELEAAIRLGSSFTSCTGDRLSLSLRSRRRSGATPWRWLRPRCGRGSRRGS
jgi:hypothetical protein